jgi:GNAT superfamily N-acetyltransferase
MFASFDIAHPGRDRDDLAALNIEYFSWLSENIARHFGLDLVAMLGMPISDYVAGALDKLCADAPPAGVFYIVRTGGAAVGMGGLRRIDADACEMKRVFVRPSARGHGLGGAIVERLTTDAAAFGYALMLLDSGPFMQAAHRRYEAAGFRDRAPYPGVEAPPQVHHDWRFMERDLRSHPG